MHFVQREIIIDLVSHRPIILIHHAVGINSPVKNPLHGNISRWLVSIIPTAQISNIETFLTHPALCQIRRRCQSHCTHVTQVGQQFPIQSGSQIQTLIYNTLSSVCKLIHDVISSQHFRLRDMFIIHLFVHIIQRTIGISCWDRTIRVIRFVKSRVISRVIIGIL